jgi:hypothetical protein
MPDVVALDSRRSIDRSLNTAVQVVPVITDSAYRVLMRHSEVSDLWQLPAVALAGGETPSDTAIRVVESFGLVPRRPHPIGGFRGGDVDTLDLGYRVEVDCGSTATGLFLPLHLAPLNADPCHSAIAQSALSQGAPSKVSIDERLGQVSGDAHLAELRMGEELPSSCPIAIAPFLEIVNARLSDSRGPERAPWLERLAELMIIDGRSHVAGDLLAESFELASASGDTETMARADIRISELEDPAAGELRAWWWVSKLSTPGAFAHLDIPFAYLGAYASRRRRTREADAYFRRALVLSEDPARRAWIKSSMSSRPIPAARVTA